MTAGCAGRWSIVGLLDERGSPGDDMLRVEAAAKVSASEWCAKLCGALGSGCVLWLAPGSMLGDGWLCSTVLVGAGRGRGWGGGGGGKGGEIRGIEVLLYLWYEYFMLCAYQLLQTPLSIDKPPNLYSLYAIV